MLFEVGETVVYPHHGAATITAVKNRKIEGEDKKYITVNIHQSELTIELPIDNADLIGLRDVIDMDGVDAVYDVLRGEVEEEAGNWSRRFKANAEKMGSGNVLRIAEVVRDLWRRQQGAGVSAGEKRMLLKAKQILVSELALALKLDDGGTTEALDAVLVTTIPAAESAEKAAA